jgi:fibronectin type 3 domain-containing protein
MPDHRLSQFDVRTALVAICLALGAGCKAEVAPAPTVPEAPVAPPLVPTSLAATSGNAQASLTWTASTGATSYEVKRSTVSGGPYTQVAASTLTSYTDTNVSNGVTYYYVVNAVNASGISANSMQAAATPAVPASIPAAPTALAATAGNTQVAMNWSASSGAASYRVKRATTSGGPYTQIATPTSTSHTDTSVTNGTTYYYVVSAVNGVGESADSAQSSAVPSAPASLPAAPTGLSAGPGNTQISLNWSASSGATGYRVKRGTASGGPYTQVATPGSTSYTDTSLTNGTVYYYVVSAVNGVGEGANSSQVSAVPVAPVSNPPPTTFGTWLHVTPAGANLTTPLGCGNYGVQTVQADPMHPSHVYTLIMCQGIWKSTDYGATWTGPINTGTNGAAAGDCAGGITIAPNSTASTPTIFAACIRGNGTGFWKSVDGGVNWTRYIVAPSGVGRQDYYPPVVDPYDNNHLLMAGHEMDYLVESTDGGVNWTNVPIAAGMHENGGTAGIFFVNTGNASTTRGTWLWMGQASGGIYGTWRTANGGAAWTMVDKNEHTHGASQMYQPDNNGVVFLAGVYSDRGWGVIRSTDYGQTWAHVGNAAGETVVVGTSKNIYAMGGGPIGIGGVLDPVFQVAAQPGTGNWVMPGTPVGLTQGSAQIVVLNDGTHNILVGAMWNSGLWRYIEP